MATAAAAIKHEEDDATDMALLDRFCLGFIIVLRNTGPDACNRLASAARKAGALRQPRTLRGPLCLQIEERLENGIIAKAKVSIHGHDLDDGAVLTSGSHMDMNLMRPLRAWHGIPEDRIGLDRRRNFTKPTAECDLEDLNLQLEAIWSCVEGLNSLIRSGLPGCAIADSKMWLRAGEVCHDLACENAAAVAIATCKVPPAGSRSSWQADYPCTLGMGRSPTWHFVAKKGGPLQKGYVKAKGLLRTEVACPNREAVVLCVGERTDVPFGGDGAVDLAVGFHEAAGELCCTALDHVRRVAASRKTPLELRAALDPLHAIADGRREGSGYTPNEQARRHAARVLNELYDTGMTHFLGARLGTKVRKALDLLSEPGGPLVRGATNGIFCVAAEFGMAAGKAFSAEPDSEEE